MAIDKETMDLMQAQMALHLATIEILERSAPGVTSDIATRLRTMRDTADVGGVSGNAISYMDQTIRTLEELARRAAERRKGG